MNEVEILFLDKAVIRGNLLLYGKSVALQFVEECRKRNIPILGIDSFKIEAETIQPLMEESIDISSQSFNEGSYDVLMDFLQKRDGRFFFEVVC